jgi:hypothetical protein
MLMPHVWFILKRPIAPLSPETFTKTQTPRKEASLPLEK